MPKVIFTKPYDYQPSSDHRVIKAYLPNFKPQAVNEECMARAIKAGVATEYEVKAKSKKTDAKSG